MHIADGILADPVWIAGIIITIILVLWSLKNIDRDDIPKIALITAALFVITYIHIPVGGSSAHLTMAGALGILLGTQAYLSATIIIILHAVTGHGGITTIGINTVFMGIPALAAYVMYTKGLKMIDREQAEAIVGGVVSAIGVALVVLLATASLLISEPLMEAGLTEMAYSLAVVHAPIVFLEGAVLAVVIGYLAKVKPEMLVKTKG
ncbi:CbiM family transporter [Methanonatronarchaeum sp. AMET6-2]|uniref:CbiM family transporter n=1 Tax=Methanonatronarchaeum sp. AMET6-2 TaxID=2933293 RepID=UPI00121E2718|nr:CbiM family transporter [Methanonatronarchaeum sp. AMET6-2]RZN63423.1 MAG: cobalamin biosynthesis protein CbiM [Methanonatronarchaeia archaeon]UOY10089.1 CbiM family transporter [Methanonatronarchaeum sp. AMET6-2]